MRPAEGEARLPGPGDGLLDTVGLYCPIPIIKTAERIKTMDPGQVLEVISDDRVILIDMPDWCRSTGHQYMGHREEGGEIHLYVRRAPVARGRAGEGRGTRAGAGAGRS